MATSALQDFEVVKKRWGRALLSKKAAVSCVNQRERLTHYWASPSEERRRRRRSRQFGRFGAFWFGTFAMLLCATRGLVGHENTRRWMVRCYKHLSVYRVWDLEIFLVLSYIACPRYPYIRVYRLYDSKLGIHNISLLHDAASIGASEWYRIHGFMIVDACQK